MSQKHNSSIQILFLNPCNFRNENSEVHGFFCCCKINGNTGVKNE